MRAAWAGRQSPLPFEKRRRGQDLVDLADQIPIILPGQTWATHSLDALRFVAMAGGTPREFTTISVSDGVGMNHEGMKFSLVSREIIADSIEAVIHGHAYDGVVGYGGCDKTLPGVIMGMVRCNVPSVFVYGGSALPGRLLLLLQR